MDSTLIALFIALFFLILLSAFFSGSETGMMAINRYRLRHLAQSGHPGAQKVMALLERPDRLIGLILLGNNFVNILASSLATLIALRLMGQWGIAVASGLLTLVILIFAEVAPKTMAALYPERIAFPAAYILTPLLRILYPLVIGVNFLANGVLRFFGVHPEQVTEQPLSSEELRTVLNEAGALIPRRHQRMLLSILDLEKVTVEDIMVPRQAIVGIDLNDDWDTILEHITHTQHTRLPAYRDSIDHIEGILHIRDVLHLLGRGALNKEGLIRVLREPYFVPEGTPLHTQLLNFQRRRLRMGLVVDEYGDILGLITLEDILEEIVGEFTTDVASVMEDIQPLEDGSYLVDGSINVRQLNRMMHWKLPTKGPRTLNGIIMEHLESMPRPGISLRIDGYTIEIVQVEGNRVKTVKIYPQREALPGG
ncbi:MAG: HlyC/CorC family transporter [Gammaproteobacteria bacterium]|nr:MAG: HlyC/CorC family transporter [Gammaproteobacteria bacterium]